MFRVGQKVVCVRPVDNLIKGDIYTLSLIEGDACRLYELEFEPKHEGYSLSRFEPLKLDYDFVEEVIKKVKPQKVEL